MTEQQCWKLVLLIPPIEKYEDLHVVVKIMVSNDINVHILGIFCHSWDAPDWRDDKYWTQLVSLDNQVWDLRFVTTLITPFWSQWDKLLSSKTESSSRSAGSTTPFAGVLTRWLFMHDNTIFISSTLSRPILAVFADFEIQHPIGNCYIRCSRPCGAVSQG